MGRSQNVRKSSNAGCQVGSVISRKGRSATPVQESTASIRKFPRRTRKINVANTKPGKVRTPNCVSERQRSLRLSAIRESPHQDDYASVLSGDKRRDPPPPLHWKDIIGSSDASASTCRDGTSDMIMPSGVSSFLLGCLDTSSPIPTPCQTSNDTSLPSPEIFRRADDDEALEFSVDEPRDLRVKNSTLLDVSHAVDIDMRQPPNLSSILEVSRKRDETALESDVAKFSVSRVGSPQARVRVVDAPFKQPKKIERARPVKCRKKVTFQESVLRKELQREEDRTEANGPRVTRQEVSGNAGTGKGLSLLEICSILQPLEDVRPGPVTLEPEDADGEVSLGDNPLTSPFRLRPWPARFFDFTDSEEKEAFLQKERGKLPNAFPSKQTPVLKQLDPVYVKCMNSEVHSPNQLHEVCWIQLLHEGESFFHRSHLKKVSTEEGVFYEDHRKVRQFHGQVFFPLSENSS